MMIWLQPPFAVRSSAPWKNAPWRPFFHSFSRRSRAPLASRIQSAVFLWAWSSVEYVPK